LATENVTDRAFDVIVIGGGMIGAATAFRLAAGGAQVGVACGGRIAGGTSAASFAWVNSAEKRPLGYHQLNFLGMAEWWALADELELGAWVHRVGGIAWAEDEAGREALKDQVARLQRWGYPVELLSPAMARRHWAPDLSFDPERVQEVAVMPEEGWVAAVPVIHALLTRVARARGHVARTARVVSILRDGERVTGVETGDGERWEAPWTVNCAGPHADAVAALAGVALPLRREPGLLVVTEPVPTGLRPVVHSPAGRFRPDGCGRLLLLTDFVSPTDPIAIPSPSLPPPDAATLMAAVARVLPDLLGASVEAARLGVRPMPPDGHPIVGPLLPGFYVTVSHSGITLGPLLGRLVAAEILTGASEPRLAPYRPGRFAGTAATGA
jgi:glycine/D-amino acid oxidase-like deaminating enzyme